MAASTNLDILVLTVDPTTTGFVADIGTRAEYNGLVYEKISTSNTAWSLTTAGLRSPLTADLDAGGFEISNIGTLTGAPMRVNDILNTTFSILQVSGITSLTANSEDYVEAIAAGGYTITLPTATSSSGKPFIFKNNSAGIVTVSRTGADTIILSSGSVTSVALDIGDFLIIISNGTQWLSSSETPSAPTSPNPVTLVSSEVQQSLTGSTSEELVTEWVYNFSDISTADIQIRLAAIVSSVTSTGTYRIRIGGTVGLVDGTIRADTGAIAAAGFAAVENLGSSFTHGGGLQLVKLTIQCGTSGTVANVRSLTVSAINA